MGIQFFAPKGSDGKTMRLPSAMRRTVRWLPQIGDICPNFVVDTTQGQLNFWEWAEAGWTFLFSHPEARTPVCTTELGSIAKFQDEFAALGLKALGLTGSHLDEQKRWHAEIESFYDSEIWFPTASDPNGCLAALFGMRHEKEHPVWPIRKSFILDPQMRVRMIFEYPISIGRSTEEVLRVVEALQLREETGAATPSDWFAHDPLIIPDDRAESQVMQQFGARSVRPLPYLRLVSGASTRERKLEVVSSEEYLEVV